MLQFFGRFYAIDSAVAEYQQSAVGIKPMLFTRMLRTFNATYPSGLTHDSFDLTYAHPRDSLAFDGRFLYGRRPRLALNPFYSPLFLLVLFLQSLFFFS